eukprot:3684634-Alexandrium_andersonii.AAC.1
MGILWQALEELLSRHGAKHALTAAWTVEIDKDLADAVEGWRSRDRRLTKKFPVVRAADNVWDLFRDNGARLKKIAETIPYKG